MVATAIVTWFEEARGPVVRKTVAPLSASATGPAQPQAIRAFVWPGTYRIERPSFNWTQAGLFLTPAAAGSLAMCSWRGSVARLAGTA